MAKTTGFDYQNKIKVCFECKMFDVTNWVSSIDRKNDPRGWPSLETFLVVPQRELEISSVAGQPLSMVIDHINPLTFGKITSMY